MMDLAVDMRVPGPEPVNDHPMPMEAGDVVPGPPVHQQDNKILPAHVIAANSKAQTREAKLLSIYDLSVKLKAMDNYDIGGTFSDSDPDLWFYFLTSVSPGFNYLMNVFVCCRKKMSLSVGISKSNEIKVLKTKKDDCTGLCTLPNALSWHTFRAIEPDECFYIKTFCFSNTDINTLGDKTLHIPIRLELSARHVLDSEVVTRIKVDHEFGALLAKQEKMDLVLQSASKKTYPVHKVILAAHSPVLRDLVKDDNITTAFIDISDTDMKLLLQFIYTGTIKDIMNQDCVKLLKIAARFQLKNLYLLTQYVVRDQINVGNAVEIAILSETFKLDLLQTTVFNFIKNNPEVLDTEGWKNLDDVNLTKKLFQFMQRRVMRSSN